MDGTGEFLDWEMLPTTETGADKMSGSDGIDGGPEGVMRADYFARGSEAYHGKTVVKENREDGSLGSDDLGGFDTRSQPRSDIDAKREVGFGEIDVAGGNSSVLREEGPVDMQFGEFQGKDGLRYGFDAKTKVGFRRIGEFEEVDVERESCSEFRSDLLGVDGKLREFDRKRELNDDELNHEAYGKEGSEGVEIDSENSGAFVPDSGCNEMMSGQFKGVKDLDELGFSKISETRDLSDSDRILGMGGGDGLDSARFVKGVENGADVAAKSGKREKKSVVWYKVPLDLLKYCVLKVSPVWSLSMAAAVVGFAILRKLFKMKQKNRNIPLKVAGIDDKKASQIMIHVARLNEAFSVVKRVPIIRSSVPGTGGVTPWSVLA